MKKLSADAIAGLLCMAFGVFFDYDCDKSSA